MKVSVVVPCYNQAQFLDTALQSVLEQSYTDWECLIINDGSTDHTEEIADLWLQKDTRFQYYQKPNGGLSSARNYGIDRTQGVYILPLDADDYISTHYIEACVKVLETQDVKLVYGQVEQFGTRIGIWDLGSYSYQNLLFSNMIHCSAMYRKQDWSSVGGYDEAMTSGLEDWEFWVHILKPEDKVVRLDTITFFYRIKDVSMIQSMNKDLETEVKAYVFKKHVSKYFDAFTYFGKENKQFKKHFTDRWFVFKHFIKLIFKF